MKLVDTDVFIDLLRGLDQAKIFFTKNQEELIFSSITEGELLSGSKCKDPKEKERVLHLMSQFDKVLVDNPLIQIAGGIRRDYALELPDAIVAASAMVTNSTLLTRNTKHYKKVKGLLVQKPY